MRAETIFALSSGSGRAGVAVIRISGPATRAVAQALLGLIPAPRLARFAAIRDPADHSIVDHGLALFFPGPASFTGEDVLELQSHGSVAVVRKLLTIISRIEDCRPADAGEFSRRAYLKGKLDLLQIEALSDLLVAETEMQRILAVEGSSWLRSRAEHWRSAIIELMAEVETQIDFGDEGDVIDRLDSATEQKILNFAEEIDSTLQRLKVGERIRQGYRIAVLGPPNAGKSSLVNALADRDLSIVSAIPGTTRDALEATIDLDGLPVVLVDTAGIRDVDSDSIEQEGIRRSFLAAQRADLVLWASPIDSPAECPNANYMVVRTKADLQLDIANRGLTVSAHKGYGLAALISCVKERALEGEQISGMRGLIAHERQASSLRQASSALRIAALHRNTTLDLRAEELRMATSALDALIGRVDQDEVLGAIFSRFCIGK
ncbi:MAG: tRNA uridine-5-carboxymethylaminomethyl(34) synthesis GTPase MnmE [Rhabdaerophilum sp.]